METEWQYTSEFYSRQGFVKCRYHDHMYDLMTADGTVYINVYPVTASTDCIGSRQITTTIKYDIEDM